LSSGARNLRGDTAVGLASRRSRLALFLLFALKAQCADNAPVHALAHRHGVIFKKKMARW
jgi:hypothetical protein